MATFAETFWKVYTQPLEAMGFGRKRSIFHRLINDEIVQVLSYNRYGSDFTIQYDFLPLCDGYDIIAFMDSNYLLNDLVPELCGRLWSCEIENCERDLYESLAYCQDTLFQYFQDIMDYQSFYDGILRIDEAHGLTKSQLSSYLHLSIFHCTFLALGQYDLALKVKKAEIDQNIDAIESYAELHHCDITAHPRYARYLGKLQYYDDLKTKINNHDFEAIKSMIRQNEDYSKRSYEKNFLGIRPQQ